jgi:hypothetical protein
MRHYQGERRHLDGAVVCCQGTDQVRRRRPGGTASDIPRVLHAALGLPIRVIDDYKGTADIRLATESGELAGGCLGWESLKTTWRKGDESGEEVEAIVQGLYKIEPAFIARMKQVLVSQLQQVSPVSIVPSVPVVESGPRSRRTSHRQDCRRCQ